MLKAPVFSVVVAAALGVVVVEAFLRVDDLEAAEALLGVGAIFVVGDALANSAFGANLNLDGDTEFVGEGGCGFVGLHREWILQALLVRGIGDVGDSAGGGCGWSSWGGGESGGRWLL